MFELLHESPIEFEGDRADNYSEGCEELLSTRFQSWIQRWYQRISSVMIMSIKRVKDEKAIIMKSDCNIALLVGKGYLEDGGL